jgi:hypothetical protein
VECSTDPSPRGAVGGGGPPHRGARGVVPPKNTSGAEGIRTPDPLDANYTQSSAFTVPTEVRRVPRAVVGSTRAAVLLYSGAVQQTASAAAAIRGVR